ncbi:MAG: tRNA (adenosine(37)-N6)-threonylcarbamoyltransferase complex ATPase subunit type 1 TsaE [Candidatus Firestonebacteria bacterium RIFOXYA2_FULL_40_8]|nr:MAG: tRNA (adenosine(37)-N6)-threonylcarbamoyltransferase complex ATPase subunit type 1 TsaE [Candidatus Firestonebacteria bacterium RIFOXYA2_FULL_40_8]
MTILHKTKSQAETVKLGEKLGKSLKPGSIVALTGNLGAGKTYLTKGIVKGLGLKSAVRSPTFVIMNIYPGKIPVFHFDCYRLKDETDMEKLGYEEYFYGEGITIIEWADRIPGIIPKTAVKVEFRIGKDNVRKISVNVPVKNI